MCTKVAVKHHSSSSTAIIARRYVISIHMYANDTHLSTTMKITNVTSREESLDKLNTCISEIRLLLDRNPLNVMIIKRIWSILRYFYAVKENVMYVSHI